MDSTGLCVKYQCESCERVLYGKCMVGHESEILVSSNETKTLDELVQFIKFCKFCCREENRKSSGKVYPSCSPRESPEPPSPSFTISSTKEPINGEKTQRDCFPSYRFTEDNVIDHSPPSATCGSDTYFSVQSSPVGFQRSSSRSDEDTEASGNHLFWPLSEYENDDVSDIDTSRNSVRHDFYINKFLDSGLSYNPYRKTFTSNVVRDSVQLEQGECPVTSNGGPFDHETMAVLEKPGVRIDEPLNITHYTSDLFILHDQYQEKPLNFENNGIFWFPPPPEDNEIEDNFFRYDDDDDDDIGESATMSSSLRSLPSMFHAKEKHSEENKEPLRVAVRAHFRALVSQLLQGANIEPGKDNSIDDWLGIVTTLAWQAANSVKPDTSRGGSMDPSDYIKVKCIASGLPSESTFVKGVICSKNIKHKRMISQYKNPRLLILGGALEYQRVPNQLSSFDKLLRQEIDHLKMIISKIEAHSPNVLLVENSVSSYAQEYLLAKEISLVLNVKRPLLERIARCTGALITPSIDSISTARLGQCKLFRLERVSEDHEPTNDLKRKPSKTLMYFEGCPRRLGCTILLKGTSRQELKKLKHVVQYAVFAGYHLSLETSFLADEGGSLPKMTLSPTIVIPEIVPPDHVISDRNSLDSSTILHAAVNLAQKEKCSCISHQSPCFTDHSAVNQPFDAVEEHVSSDLVLTVDNQEENRDVNESTMLPFDISNGTVPELQSPVSQDEMQSLVEPPKLAYPQQIDENEPSNEIFSATECHQSILVSYSSRRVSNGTLCERPRLFRIKFYGCFDQPLGKYLHNNLFNQKIYCGSGKQLGEAHVQCFTHQQGSLTVSVRRLPNLKLQGERDGKIWMWHRCLKCELVNGIPPATLRGVMSDAAYGLSFGKFLELSFSNHATANRVATCGHSLQRDCLRFYGFGSMVAFFRYSPVDILSVHLPPQMIEFNGHVQQDWIRKEATNVFTKMEILYAEITDVLNSIASRIVSLEHKSPETIELHQHIIELDHLIQNERDAYKNLLQSVVDILELNYLRRSLIVGSHVWDSQLHSLDSILRNGTFNLKELQAYASFLELKDWKKELSIEDGNLNFRHEEKFLECREVQVSESEPCPGQRVESSLNLLESDLPDKEDEHHPDGEINAPSPAPSLSDKIDSAWAVGMVRQINEMVNPRTEKTKLPKRAYSYDSATIAQDRIRKGFSTSALHLSKLRSFHASGENRNMIRTYSKESPHEAQNLSSVFTSAPSLISSSTKIAEGARLLLPQTGKGNIVIAVYDNEPTSIISYALNSKEYEDLIADDPCEKEGSTVSSMSSWQSFGSLDLDYVHYGIEDASLSIGSLFTDTKKSSHFKISFADESLSGGGKVKFSVTCYFAKQFQAFRSKCCPSEVHYIRSLSRCKRWSAQGGKSNVFFAKSLDERFIIKQVTKTELESFEEFAPDYFKYLSDSLTSKSPSCVAKILGIYQVSVKYLNGGRETKIDLMVMENLFFNRNISRVYDLKGSERSRYNPDTTGTDAVLLDMNLLETLRTNPIFLSSKAKRSLERAVWNDTSFLASVDVMDYSLLVGFDKERKELVMGIIDIMRQYTWDKHLETWVKASGILGGPKNVSPTIISPKQYKRRFRTAMKSYFLTVPDQ